jgi:hypothetical protein
MFWKFDVNENRLWVSFREYSGDTWRGVRLRQKPELDVDVRIPTGPDWKWMKPAGRAFGGGDEIFMPAS